jgi:hypothetical protein
MVVRQPRYSKEEFAQRGDLIYQTQIRPQVELDNHGKIVAIDLETGDFEVDASEIAACDRLEARHRDAQIWIVRVGSRHVRRFGGRTKRTVQVFEEGYSTVQVLLTDTNVFSKGWMILRQEIPALSVNLLMNSVASTTCQDDIPR